MGSKYYGEEIKGILSEDFGVEFIRYKGREKDENKKFISELYIDKEKTVIFDDNITVWDNNYGDHEHVISSKFFYDEECANVLCENDFGEDKAINEINIFLQSYKSLLYNKIENNDWRQQTIVEYKTVPFYQFEEYNIYNNKCFIAEYLNSTKFQFFYMKNVIKQIYCLRFYYGVEIPLAIKLIRLSTLNNLKFELKFLGFGHKMILRDIITTCGGGIYQGENLEKNEKIYVVVLKRIYKNKSKEIQKDINKKPYYVLINERFILDTYFFMTNIRDNINDPEYILN